MSYTFSSVPTHLLRLCKKRMLQSEYPSPSPTVGKGDQTIFWVIDNFIGGSWYRILRPNQCYWHKVSRLFDGRDGTWLTSFFVSQIWWPLQSIKHVKLVHKPDSIPACELIHVILTPVAKVWQPIFARPFYIQHVANPTSHKICTSSPIIVIKVHIDESVHRYAFCHTCCVAAFPGTPFIIVHSHRVYEMHLAPHT